MSVLAWMVLGLVAGFIASKIVNKSGEGVFLDIVLGIVGAIAGGWVFTAFGGVWRFWRDWIEPIQPAIIVAVVGAVILLVAYHAIRSTTHRTS